MRNLKIIVGVFLSSLFIQPLVADDCSTPFFGEIGIGYDYFRSLPEGDWEGNTGALTSLNFGIPVDYDNYGIGAQVGGSFGVYDWTGRGSAPSEKQNATQRQAFVTAGIYRKTPNCTGFNFGLVYDWMWNKNAGVFALDNTLSQLRFQEGYVVNQKNEWGIWGTFNLNTAHKDSLGIPVSFRAISQVNLYWEHIYDNFASTMIWVGIPYRKSLMYSTGRAGKFILGGSFHAPLTCRFSIDGHACYMAGHSAPGALKQRNYAANICLELKWAFGDTSYESRPYMSVGNNSNFLVDTSVTF